MIKVPEVGIKTEKATKRGEIKLAHFPNGSLCWAVRSKAGQFFYFDFGNNNGKPPQCVVRFANKETW